MVNQSTNPDPADLDELREAARRALSQTSGELQVPGLREPVEVLRDTWGVPHIYARNRHDLFFAQGYVQVQDRLWQMEVWRREAEGRLAEIGGEALLPRDRLARLMRYRGDLDAEWESYGPGARDIVESFVAGVNAFIDGCAGNPPIEFQLMGIKPEPWTPEVCLGRMAGLVVSRNAAVEGLRALLLAEVGPAETAKLLLTSPATELAPAAGPAVRGLEQVVELLSTVTLPVRLPFIDQLATAPTEEAATPALEESNNWVVSGALSSTGKPLLANDPHRLITTPSLRYVVHLVCPPSDGDAGWNVIGGSEPAIPGVTIGHNDRIAWGVTTVNTDQQDLYIEEIDPDDPSRYRTGDEWRSFEVEHHTFKVRGESEPRHIDLKFTRHGPVLHEDAESRRAIALRWAGAEPGGGGYLGSLAIDQARDQQTFLEAAARWKTPSANLVYADVDGHIGWIAAALTPVRSGSNGLTPVSGADGRHEWQGWLPTSELPQVFDPDQGYIATANQNMLPPGYAHPIAFDWSPPFRFQRIDEVLRTGKRFGIEDFKALQHDITSLPARRLIALLRNTGPADPSLQQVVSLLLEWDTVLDRDSAAAALYKTWVAHLVQKVTRPRVPEHLWPRYSTRPMAEVLIGLLENPDSKIGEPVEAVLLSALQAAAGELTAKFGAQSAWRWGALHRAHFRHMISPAATPSRAQTAREATVSALTDLPSMERGGDADTPMATSGLGFDQTGGASYCQIMDVGNWDASVAKNSPGQSGQPGSPHYGDLLEPWEAGDYFPLAFSREAVEAVTTERLLLS